MLQRTGSASERKRRDGPDTKTADLEAFAAAIEGEAAYPYTDEQMIHNIEVLEAVAESARSRTVVHLPGN